MGLPPGSWGISTSMQRSRACWKRKPRALRTTPAEAAFLQGAAAAQEGAYRDLVGSLNISVEEMKRMLRDCLPR